ncbi:hypothetical protein Y71_04610 [Kosakonia radicincitans DSM 16656]|uniref:hypothetical protein n=1 Tax=Kosakonia TaxID=1330547 RepID=UPI0004619F0A|nr:MULTISPECIES: hypothetical protein [Kosakonia]APG19636.1 hypothetical protein A3780_19485 [Kosakonia radicincitans]ARD59239.1 hypothetical protein Y71_04610 [Kosakonia radicincitans DSM 16656]KDE35731.1 hypothetical protein AW40_15085 [Kosakonia radicincitans UMEnt01/12]MDD7995923.1 hypothetical protein [Kosakonia radicincitans]QEM90032.1 hypothetical protein FEI17_04900 [Kosakonia radicincitans]
MANQGSYLLVVCKREVTRWKAVEPLHKKVLPINTGKTFSYTLRKAVSIVCWWRVLPHDRVVIPEVLIGERSPRVAYSNYTNLRRCAGFFLPALLQAKRIDTPRFTSAHSLAFSRWRYARANATIKIPEVLIGDLFGTLFVLISCTNLRGRAGFFLP